MNTDELVAVLARSAAPVDRPALVRRFRALLVSAAALSLVAMLIVLGPRPDWRSAVELPMFWMKLAFPAAVALAAFGCMFRLGHPGARLGAWPLALAAPVGVVWLMAAQALAGASPSQRIAMVLGLSWWHCVLLVSCLAVPGFVLAFRALRTLAPTRLVLAGFFAGLFAGGAAAFAYAFSCIEMEPAFLGSWYLLGMLVPAVVGACMGTRLLRW